MRAVAGAWQDGGRRLSFRAGRDQHFIAGSHRRPPHRIEGRTLPICATRDEILLRDLARRGRLAAIARTAPPRQYARLASAAYGVVWPVVYARVTRPVERRRGHRACTVALRRMADECLDGFHDDVESAVRFLLGARVPIADLEAWLAGRVVAATVDGHRRRRGERGALQRPRVPGWLAAGLDHDPWLCRLAVRIMEWVGVPATAGAGVWPLESWAAQRAGITGDWAGSDSRAVVADVDRVLTAMRRRPAWHADYIERPLGRKVAPVAPPPGDTAGDPRPLVPVTPDEADDRRLTGLAATAVDAIAAGLRRAGDPRDVVTDVLRRVFGEGTGGDEIDRAPGTAPGSDERLSALLADPRALDRIVAAAVRIVEG